MLTQMPFESVFLLLFCSVATNQTTILDIVYVCLPPFCSFLFLFYYFLCITVASMLMHPSLTSLSLPRYKFMVLYFLYVCSFHCKHTENWSQILESTYSANQLNRNSDAHPHIQRHIHMHTLSINDIN